MMFRVHADTSKSNIIKFHQNSLNLQQPHSDHFRDPRLLSHMLRCHFC